MGGSTLEDLKRIEEKLDEFYAKKCCDIPKTEFQDFSHHLLGWENYNDLGEVIQWNRICKKFVYLTVCPDNFDDNVWNSF